MPSEYHFRRILPVSQIILAALLGGWGLWIRNSLLSRPFFGSSTGWDSTARFHVWPWPLKFATVLNMPAFLAGLVPSGFLDYLRPGLPEWLFYLPMLLFVPLLWHWIGSRLDKQWNAAASRAALKRQWLALLIFALICAVGSSVPESVGGYTSYLSLGALIWLASILAWLAWRRFHAHRKRPA